MGRKGKCGRKPSKIINGVKVSQEMQAFLNKRGDVYYYYKEGKQIKSYIPGEKTERVRFAMKDFMKILNPDEYVQADRGKIVNMNKVVEVVRLGDSFAALFNTPQDYVPVAYERRKEFLSVLDLFPNIIRPKNLTALFMPLFIALL